MHFLSKVNGAVGPGVHDVRKQNRLHAGDGCVETQL